MNRDVIINIFNRTSMTPPGPIHGLLVSEDRISVVVAGFGVAAVQGSGKKPEKEDGDVRATV